MGSYVSPAARTLGISQHEFELGQSEKYVIRVQRTSDESSPCSYRLPPKACYCPHPPPKLAGTASRCPPTYNPSTMRWYAGAWRVRKAIYQYFGRLLFVNATGDHASGSIMFNNDVHSQVPIMIPAHPLPSVLSASLPQTPSPSPSPLSHPFPYPSAPHPSPIDLTRSHPHPIPSPPTAWHGCRALPWHANPSSCPSRLPCWSRSYPAPTNLIPLKAQPQAPLPSTTVRRHPQRTPHPPSPIPHRCLGLQSQHAPRRRDWPPL